MKKYLFLFLLLTFIETKAQSLGSWERQSSIRYGHTFGKGFQNKKVYSVGADFLLPIDEEEFYIGGKLSFITNITREEKYREYHSPNEWTTYYDEKKKVISVYPEITLRKYFWERNICPYAQAGISWASSSLFVGIKPQVMLFELDLSMGYHLPFYKDTTERVPFLPRGFQFILSCSIPFEVLGLEI